MSDHGPLSVAVIIGSTRTDRFGPTPARWIAQRADQHEDLTVDLIDLKETALPETLAGDDENVAVPDSVQALSPRLARADAFIVVTPVYNHGYPAPLKTAIDWFYEEWNAKPVGFVSYGGISGGLHAVEQLRPVFNELHAHPIRNVITFPNFWECFDDHGAMVDEQSVDNAAKNFLDQLTWWAHTLRDGRTRRPYVQ